MFIRLKIASAVIATLAFVGCIVALGSGRATAEVLAGPYIGDVDRVVDGDTLSVKVTI